MTNRNNGRMTHLLLTVAALVCFVKNAAAFVPSPTTASASNPTTKNPSAQRYEATRNDENEIKSTGNEMMKTEELPWSNNINSNGGKKNNKNNNKNGRNRKLDKKVDPSAQLKLDKYHFTTKSNKELIFDERTGRFFETSIRPGSLHQLWQEYLQETDDDKNQRGDPRTAINDFSSNDMISTDVLFGTGVSLPSSLESSEVLLDDEEECLVHTPYQDSCEPTPWNVLNDDNQDQKITSKAKRRKSQLSLNEDTWSPPTIVEECYKAWNQRDMVGAAKCFVGEQLEYRDYQYLGKITSRQQLEEHFTQQANLLPPNSKLVVDHLAYNEEMGKIATQWHLERPDGSTVKFTKGCSFYTLDQKSGLIKSGYRASEMMVKPNRSSVNALLSTLSPTWGSIDARNTKAVPKDFSKQSTTCVIERYFDAWNRRDMETALDCLDDNGCVYQTEDPVFVGSLNGKKAIREHLIQNANVLPSSAKIVLDDLAVDTRRNAAVGTTTTIGTRWHLEVNGVTIPNLQGCSMYTTDPDTGRIKTALDITEAPVKLPRQVLQFMWAPAVALFDWN